MKKVALTAAMLLPFIAFCQNASPEKPQRKMTYGINIGNHFSTVHNEGKPLSADPGASVKNGLGFRLGLLAQRPITKRLSVIAMPELAFYDNRFEFNYPFMPRKFQMAAANVELAVHLAYKITNGRSHPYVILGPSFRQPLADKMAEVNEVSGAMVAMDAGIGFEAALKRFRIAPELRYSYNINAIQNNVILDDLHMHVVSFVLCFKG